MFEKINWIVACNNLLAYTDLYKLFEIYADARGFQIETFIFISQEGRQIDLEIRKLTIPKKVTG